MIDLRNLGEGWPDVFKPIGEGETFDKEPFQAWWARCGSQMPHLHPVAAEQWVHRHWRHSPFAGLPLDRLSSRIETWPTDHILRDVYNDDELHPDWDFEKLSGHRTGRIMMTRGTWDYPMLVLETPGGFIDYRGEHPDSRFRLVEGHLRYRFLNAQVARGEAGREHQLVIMRLLSL